MEAEPLLLPDKTVIDTTKPPPEFPFPKPDFSEIVQDHTNELSANDKSDAPVLKPTFKNALQAKKRLQAFSSIRPGSLPTSPQKVKPNLGSDEKSDEGSSPVATKKTPRKGHTHDDKAKAVIKEIEELKKEEQAFLESQRHSYKRSRSRSRSTDKGRFKKVDKKSRNYRRRSASPEKPRKSPKKQKRYPRNWREFCELDTNLESLNRDFEVSTPSGNTDLIRQVLFESPSLPIVPFKMKTVNREEKVVPFEYVRYTQAKPIVSYSVNFTAIKQASLSKKLVLEALPKHTVTLLEKLHSNSIKFPIAESDPKAKNSKIWYPKAWNSSENECKVLEKSVGLSFLQNYTGEEEESEIIEEETSSALKTKTTASSNKEKKSSHEETHADTKKEKDNRIEEDSKKKKNKSGKDDDLNKEQTEGAVEKKKSNKTAKDDDEPESSEKKNSHKTSKDDDATIDQSEGVEKKKINKIMNEDHTNNDQPENVEKKKKKKHKEKNKQTEEGDVSTKKKKNKKDKSKKIGKRSKEKKPKHKKTKDKKKKKDKLLEKSVDKPSKQQVIEELKEIEEKLAKKREEGKERKTPKEESTRKGKNEEDSKKGKHEEDSKKGKHEEDSKKGKHEEDPKKGKHEDDLKRGKHEEDSKKGKHEEDSKKGKHEDDSKRGKHEDDGKKTKPEKHKASDENNSDMKIEHALKNKLKKMEAIPKPQSHHSRRSDKHEESQKKSEHRKPKHIEELEPQRKRKSRWSEDVPMKEFPLPVLKVIEEISINAMAHANPMISDDLDLEDLKVIEEIKENTPDTDEYHSHWESDDDVSSSVPRNSLKLNRSWESDEELFERSHNRDKKPAETYTNLEIPLNIKNFSRRSSNWDTNKPFSVIEELKMLEEERRSLSEERKKLELEKQKIKKLQEEVKLDRLDEKRNLEDSKEAIRLRSLTPENVVRIKKEKCEVNDFSIDSLNNSLLSTVSSTESNFPVGVLENQYEEFIKAVSSESSVAKKKLDRRSSSSSLSSWSSDSDHKKKRRKLKMKKKKKKKKSRECEGLLLGKGNNIFNEFDIPVPSDLPEMVPTPVPVPSPILPLDKILPLTTPLLLNPVVTIPEKLIIEPQSPQEIVDIKKPFVFSSIVLPSKKTPLVDNSKLKLDDDSDSADFTDKFVKKPESKETADECEELDKTILEEKIPEEAPKLELTEPETAIKPLIETEIKPKPEIVKPPTPTPIPLEELQNVPLPPEKSTPPVPEAKPYDKEPKIKRSRSLSPSRKSKGKRRSRSISRERDSKRRSPIRRRELTPPSRRRHPSPRRRSPPRRRGSPWRRSPSPRRRSPRRRRRSPSFSPPRSRNGTRKRTPSPRRRASPLNSPLDGFKKSVADSTISDDMLPQPNPDDYNDSPNAYGGGAKYYDRSERKQKRGSNSPQMSPKRISLDDRINLVLGLEKNEPIAPLPPKPPETYPNYNYNNAYTQQYPSYGQYGQQKPDYAPQVVSQPFAPMMYTQPPPPIVKPVPTPTKVLQVGNILQVVPSEEITPPMIENKTPERSQKIVQVGNMLQIVPAVISPPKPQIPIPEPQPVSQPVQIPEKQSAEALMKQKNAERKAEREKRRQERERRRKEKEQKRKEREKRKQMKFKMKTENMIKRAIQIETEAMANEDMEEEGDTIDMPVPVVVSTPPTCKSILLQRGSKKRKSVQFADGIRPGEGTSPSGGEELSSPPPPKLPKEKRYKKKGKKRKVRVKVVKKVQNTEEEEDEDEEDNYLGNMPPPPPPPGSPPPHVFPARVKTHTINNVHQYVGNIIQSNSPGFPFRSPMQVVMNRHQPPPGYLQGAYPTDVNVNSLSHPTYQGVPSHH